MRGLEPPTSASQTPRATRLRHTPSREPNQYRSGDGRTARRRVEESRSRAVEKARRKRPIATCGADNSAKYPTPPELADLADLADLPGRLMGGRRSFEYEPRHVSSAIAVIRGSRIVRVSPLVDAGVARTEGFLPARAGVVGRVEAGVRAGRRTFVLPVVPFVLADDEPANAVLVDE